MYPAGTVWEELKLTAFLRKSLRGSAQLFPALLDLNGEDGKNNLGSRSNNQLHALLLALECLNFRLRATCIVNMQKAINQNRFEDAARFMRKNHIYIDKRNTRGTKLALIFSIWA